MGTRIIGRNSSFSRCPYIRNVIELENGLYVDCYPIKHPGGNFALRFKEGGKTFVFATDAEFTGETLERVGVETDFFLNADLLILDSQYTLDEHSVLVAHFEIPW